MNKIYNFEDYSAPTLSEQMADVELPWELVPGGFHRIQHYYPGKYFYVARKLDPRIVTYCAHVKGEKALNLPFQERRTIMNINYPEDILCGATKEPCHMGMYCNCLCCKFEFISHARRINNRDYLTRPLDPRIVTYCPHVKGAKALNLPF